MATTRLLALIACLALAGCAAPRNQELYVAAVQRSRADPIHMPRDPATPPTREATLAYWTGRFKAGSLTGAEDADEIGRRLGQSAAALRKLPVLGVDPELVEKTLVVAREMQNTARLSQFIHDECWLVPDVVVKELLNTGSLLTQADDAVNAMRPVLSQRYGVEFPAE